MRWLALAALGSLAAQADVIPPSPQAAPAEAPVERPAEAPSAPAIAPPPAAEHPGGNASAPGMQQQGVIEGGWSYVYAAWGAAILGLVLYGASLVLRRPEPPPPGAP